MRRKGHGWMRHQRWLRQLGPAVPVTPVEAPPPHPDPRGPGCTCTVECERPCAGLLCQGGCVPCYERYLTAARAEGRTP